MNYNVETVEGIFKLASEMRYLVTVIGIRSNICSNVKSELLKECHCVNIPVSVSSNYETNQNYFSDKVLFILSRDFDEIMLTLDIVSQKIYI